MAGANRRDMAKDAFWRRLINEWRESGETRRVFCQRRGVTLTAMAFWQQEIIRRDRELSNTGSSTSTSTSTSTSKSTHSTSSSASTSTSKSTCSASSSATTPRTASTMATPKQAMFVPVRVVTSVAVEIVLANGRVLRVPAGVDDRHLRMVLAITEDASC